ncbi:SDR family NAD(P)-dependent oxidoreductase [Eubacterium barkeri]|uniref:3-oxoacyl-[acyl-carrier protein] reductase n=1 Tax=Eubacterium barkeri TaxID=1528 RepID=A0A1H3I776_EUBBA|nr:SDR family NAD(P)-dependent oxidoreductase [Eubacterium barkeri]SDY22784.1 3-oxoacyl-[acyl-carrier protein] reductase [Eubacterium barkeri]
MDFYGKTTVVTGAASGLGAEVANAFAEAGANVALLDLNEDGVKKKQAELASSSKGKIVGIACDLTNFDAVQLLNEKVEEEIGQIDVLCNIAGANPAAVNKKIIEQDKKGWDTVINLNLNIAFNCIRSFVPGMTQRGYGKVVNISSVAGVMGGGLMGKGAYAAAKAGVIGLTKVLAREVGEFGVNVNCIAPGMHFTPLVQELNSDEGARDTIKRIVDNLPLHTGGDPADLAQLFLFLSSDSAKFMTGDIICCDGGYSMH